MDDDDDVTSSTAAESWEISFFDFPRKKKQDKCPLVPIKEKTAKLDTAVFGMGWFWG